MALAKATLGVGVGVHSSAGRGIIEDVDLRFGGFRIFIHYYDHAADKLASVLFCIMISLLQRRWLAGYS